MKLAAFSLNGSRDLPKDFADHNDSVWISVDTDYLEGKRVAPFYKATIDELVCADEIGFDLIGVNEHHSNAYGMSASPNLIAAVLADRTENAGLLVLGNSLALYNPPQRVAEEMAMIDCLSNGRLVAGFPVGTAMDTCFAYGMNPSELRDRYLEAYELIMQAWNTPGVSEFNGRFIQQRYLNIVPRPIQKPNPPVWIPGGGSVETWETCARTNSVYAYLTYFGYQSGEATIRGYWSKMKELGREPNPYSAAIVQFIGVAETRKEALELYAEPANYFFANCLHVNPGYVNPPGYITEDTVRAKLESQVAKAVKKAEDKLAKGQAHMTGKFTFEQMIDVGYVIVGTPDEVAEQLRNIAISQNVGNMILMTQYGSMNTELTKYNMELIGKQVKPQVKDIFANEWEHHWMPAACGNKQEKAA